MKLVFLITFQLLVLVILTPKHPLPVGDSIHTAHYERGSRAIFFSSEDGDLHKVYLSWRTFFRSCCNSDALQCTNSIRWSLSGICASTSKKALPGIAAITLQLMYHSNLSLFVNFFNNISYVYLRVAMDWLHYVTSIALHMAMRGRGFNQVGVSKIFAHAAHALLHQPHQTKFPGSAPGISVGWSHRSFEQVKRPDSKSSCCSKCAFQYGLWSSPW